VIAQRELEPAGARECGKVRHEQIVINAEVEREGRQGRRRCQPRALGARFAPR
jgi:hypothetical protein